MRGRAILSAAFVSLAGYSWAGTQLTNLAGTAVTIDGGQLYFVDCRDGTRRAVVTDAAIQTQTGCERFYNFVSARFSADGTRLVFSGRYRTGATYDNYGIWVCDNNGANIEFLHRMVKSSETHKMNWASDGHIYWSEETDSVWRISVTTKQPEIYWANVGVEGYSGINVKNICVSQDGRRAVSSSHGMVHALDMVNKRLVYTYVAGCDGAISGLGGYVIQKETVSDHEPAIALNTHSCVAFVWVFGSVPAALDTSYVWAAGWPETQDVGDRMEQPQGASNNDDYFVGQGRENNAANSYVYQRGTSNYCVLPNYVTDFYLGVVPSPPGGSRIALSPSTLTFDSPDRSTPAAKTVTATNSGQGTLSAVTITESAAWLQVSVSGSGNTQTLTNAISVAGLTAGTYTTTVTVSGGGASNSVNYTVTLNFGTVVAAPSNLTANGMDSLLVALAWTDNSGNENGFVVQRLGASAWQSIGSTGPNAAVYTDSNLLPGVYTYRVAAWRGVDTSSFSDQASIALAARESLLVTAPQAGAQVAAGSVFTITWQAANISGVIVELSTDDGENWVLLPMAGGSIQPGQPYWQAYPWQVATGATSSACLIRVAKYTDHNVSSVSGTFSIVPASAVRQTPAAVTAGRTPPRRLVDLQGRALDAGAVPQRSRVAIVKECGAFAVVVGR